MIKGHSGETLCILAIAITALPSWCTRIQRQTRQKVDEVVFSTSSVLEIQKSIAAKLGWLWRKIQSIKQDRQYRQNRNTSRNCNNTSYRNPAPPSDRPSRSSGNMDPDTVWEWPAGHADAEINQSHNGGRRGRKIKPRDLIVYTNESFALEVPWKVSAKTEVGPQCQRDESPHFAKGAVSFGVWTFNLKMVKESVTHILCWIVSEINNGIPVLSPSWFCTKMGNCIGTSRVLLNVLSSKFIETVQLLGLPCRVYCRRRRWTSGHVMHHKFLAPTVLRILRQYSSNARGILYMPSTVLTREACRKAAVDILSWKNDRDKTLVNKINTALIES